MIRKIVRVDVTVKFKYFLEMSGKEVMSMPHYMYMYVALTTVKPALLINALARDVRTFVVAFHDVVASTPQLALLAHTAVAPRAQVDDAHLHARHWHSSRAVRKRSVVWRHQRTRTQLRHTVA